MESWVQWAIGLAVLLLGGMFARQDWEIRQLRAWRHKMGEDPNKPLAQLLDLYQQENTRRLIKLEAKVFNGANR